MREDAAAREGAAYTTDGKVWPKPTEVLLAPGDAAVILYHVPHNATRNTSDAVRGGQIVPRLQCYARVVNAKRKSVDKERPEAGKSALLDLWSDWDGLQQDLPRLRVEREQALQRARTDGDAGVDGATGPVTAVWGQAAKL